MLAGEWLHRRLLAMAALLLAALAAMPAAAQTAPRTAQRIELPVSEGTTLTLPQPATTVFIADTAIADVQTPTNTVVFVFGKKPGRTTLFALDENGNRILSAQVAVFQPLDEIRKLLRDELKGNDITLRQTPNGVVLGGLARNAEVAETARNLVAQSLGPGASLLNRLKVASKLQVSLHVRVIEVSRTLGKRLGFNWTEVGDVAQLAVLRSADAAAVGGPLSGLAKAAAVADTAVNVIQLIDRLAAEGHVRVLAEPNLTAVSGETATFLAGGQFPVPVQQGNTGTVSVSFQNFGVGLEFVPTVLSDDLISMRVKPEVSELAGPSVTVGSLSVPFLTTRRAETTVELGSGQSFAIGGLIRSNTTQAAQAFPALSRLPVIGPLFRTSGTNQQDSELVIIVTPFIVRPVSSPRRLQDPAILPPTTTAGITPVAVPPPLALHPAPPKPRPVRRPVRAACRPEPAPSYQLRDGPVVAAPAPRRCAGAAPLVRKF
jgi:pilus assembly protein CpaC